ncbi:MAG TPA: two-component regulator propeller domain-containing protein [Flavipsychrobacter sp.]|nr:two-component regulator propeller domain-containing protein [Flavipsychrobacter sp.]
MNIFRYLPSLIIVFTLSNLNSEAQDRPIGYWRSHMPYNTALGAVTDGNSIFTICNQSFFYWDNVQHEYNPYSKVEGMSDVGMGQIGYDTTTNTVILAYQNDNIDLFKDNSFFNIPDLKNKMVTGSKVIHNIYTYNGAAYLSTDIGIVVIDLATKNIKETYVFVKNNQPISINGFSAQGNYFYAATNFGLFRADKNSPQLQNFAVWQQLDSIHSFNFISGINNKLYLSTNDSLFTFTNDSLKYLYASKLYISHVNAFNDGVWFGEYDSSVYKGDEKKIDTNYNPVDSFTVHGYPAQLVETNDGSLWLADVFNGLQRRIGPNSLGTFYPPGPASPSNFDIHAYNKEVYVAHGGYNDLLRQLNTSAGFSAYKDGNWTSRGTYTYQPFGDTVSDIMTVLKDQATGTIYGGSFEDGFFSIQPNGDYQLIKHSPFFDPNYTLYPAVTVLGMAIDNQDNLWISLLGATHELVVKTSDNNWYNFSVGTTGAFNFAGGQIIIDDNGQKWWAVTGGGGVIVYNDNGTISDPSDDTHKQLIQGVGLGNLPSSTVFSLAKDQDGNIWIGTNNGIAIVNCPGQITQSNCSCNGQSFCDAQIPIVQYDQFAGYLFSGENVRTIAVDGANRKWVGTDNGVWLLSPDASKIIYRFTQDNSPLPSNLIQKIAVDPITGDVYIGTQQGLVSYHSTATEGTTSNQNVLVYPDPIPSGYNGTIAIKGLAANSDVRITDISGQLVYRTTALGGQAVWNGYDYTGHRPESGVYLIFATNSDGSQTYVGKMAFIQ